MALSGSLDTFELPDVLRLLVSTAKTGRLRVAGDRGSGSVWVDDGMIVTTELAGPATSDPTDEEALFGMLRFAAGSFTFEADATVATDDSSRPLEPVLGAAERMLVEWRAIEEVVPSLEVWATLAAELGESDVMIDAGRWSCIAAVGSGATVGTVADTIGLGEIDACRTVKELIELGLVELTDPPADAPTRPADEHTVDEDTAAEDTADVGTESSFDHDGDENEDDADPLAPSDTTTVPALASLGSTEGSDASEDPMLSSGDPLEQMSESSASDDDDESSDDDEDEDEDRDLFAEPSGDELEDGDLDPAEMARQLANLSPKAAKAVAAAAKASTDAERDAALAAVEAEDDSVNRGLLLKFLGSVDS